MNNVDFLHLLECALIMDEKSIVFEFVRCIQEKDFMFFIYYRNNKKSKKQQ